MLPREAVSARVVAQDSMRNLAHPHAPVGALDADGFTICPIV